MLSFRLNLATDQAHYGARAPQVQPKAETIPAPAVETIDVNKIQSFQEMMRPYKKKIADFEAARECLQKEQSRIQAALAAIDPELNSARISVLRRELEQALVDARPEAIERKKTDLAAIESEREEGESRLRTIAGDLQHLCDTEKQIAQEILDANYSAICRDVETKFEESARTVEEAWVGLRQFARLTQLKLTSSHAMGLMANSVRTTEALATFFRRTH